jgi:hypothetical protein
MRLPRERSTLTPSMTMQELSKWGAGPGDLVF